MPLTIDHLSISLLDNIESDIDEVQFPDNPFDLRIVRRDLLSDLRAKSLMDKIGLESEVIVINGRNIKTWNHVLEYHFNGEIELPFNENYDRKKPEKIFDDIVTSLRLLKSWFVDRSYAFNTIKNDPSLGNHAWSSTKPSIMNSEEKDLKRFNRYELHADDINNLKRVFLALIKCDDERLRIAISRFNKLYEIQQEVDELIDIMIGFEALYLDGNDELRFRLATRASKHLGKNPSDCENIYKHLLSAYELRSSIVHGSKNILRDDKLLKKCGWNSPAAMIDDLSSYLRKAILLILVDMGIQKFKNFHTELDLAIVRGNAFKPNSGECQ